VTADAAFDPCGSPHVAAFVRRLSERTGPFPTIIHPGDEMYRYHLAMAGQSPDTAAVHYFATGEQIFRAAAQILEWRFGSLDRVSSLLDFASGYGRTTRFLARVLAPERIVVTEIDPGAARFQEEAFGVRGVGTGSEPASFRIERAFDAILAVSFFSHLPAGRFETWLATLYGRLAPGGILVFSVHGMALLPGLEKDPVTGIVFRPVSETSRLDGSEYGTSYVSPEFVRGVAGRAAPGASLHGFPFGLTGFQDLYVLVRPPVPPLPPLWLDRYPWGALDGSEIRNGIVSIQGWAAGDAGERPPAVRLMLGEASAGFLPGEGPVGSQRRWSFGFRVDEIELDTIVRVEAESEKGLSKIILISTLRPHVAAPASGPQ
jgi:SAM-dependent methyltransferase